LEVGMKRVTAITATALAITLVGSVRPVAAQQTERVEVSGGYQLLYFWANDNGESASETLDKGWYSDVCGNVTPLIGIAFQVSGNYKTYESSYSSGDFAGSFQEHVKMHQFLGGFRVNGRQRPVRPFGQVLLGAFHVTVSGEGSMTAFGETTTFEDEGNSETDFVVQVGGGADIMLSKRIGVRTGFDYSRIFVEGGGVNAFRLAVGGVFTF
jgi:opacity protein-like surface antigen